MLDTPLQVAVVLGAFGFALELLTLFMRSKQLRQLMYFCVVILTAPAAAGLAANDLRLGTALVATAAAYRIFNALRVVYGRTKEVRLLAGSRRTTLVLGLYQLLAVGLWRLGLAFDLSAGQVLFALSAGSLAAGAVMLGSVLRTLGRAAIRPSDKYISDSELPTVSICIPARNETAYLPACLQSVLKSDYPKLEVLVLDDCSQDNTSEIIKGFAQKGVRFIKGEEPNTGWLAKNQAYQALSEAASGELLLFMGVDARLEASTVRAMVGSLSARRKQMISVLPRARQTAETDAVLQPMRYWWELALPRRRFNRPPVLSTAWIITRQALFGRGEFRAVRGSVLPEAYFARQLTRGDEYSFMRAGGKLAVSSVKRLPEQWNTAVRTRYPQARQRPENVFVIALAILWFLGLPLGLTIAGFFTPLGWLGLLAGLNTALLLFTHYRVVSACGFKDRWTALVLFPAAVLAELAAGHISMWRYEFSDVIWKDRNICIPVMKHYSKLPPA